MIKSENGTIKIEGHLIDVLADLYTLFYGIVHDNDIPINRNTLVLMASNADHDNFKEFIAPMIESLDKKTVDSALDDLFGEMFRERRH